MRYFDKEVLSELAEDLVVLWNEFCYENLWDDIIYENNQQGLYDLFNGDESLKDLARAMYYGSYNYLDEYIMLDGNNNLKSFREYDVIDHIDYDELETWCNDNLSNEIVRNIVIKYQLDEFVEMDGE